MTLTIPPQFALCSMEHWLSGYNRPAITTLGINVAGLTLDPDEVAELYSTTYRAALGPRFDTNVTMRDCRAVVGQTVGEPRIGFNGTASTGARNNESTPPALALMVDKRTLLGGRRNRGRMYLPWALADTEVSEIGAIIPAVVTAWQGLFNTFLANLDSAGIPPVLLHGAGLTATPAPTDISSFSVNPTVRTQRRRQVRY